MRYLTILGLLAVACAAVMAFAATASATTITLPTGTVVSSTYDIQATNENGHVTLHNPEINISCIRHSKAMWKHKEQASQPAAYPTNCHSPTAQTNGRSHFRAEANC